MKKYALLFSIILGMMMCTFNTYASHRSQLVDPGISPDNSSFPEPFSELNNPVNAPAISTGYYFVDSDDEAPDYWRPAYDIQDTTTDQNLWRRIVPGARILDKSYWDAHPDEGLRFFRNPALPLSGQGDFWTNPTDSTDDAIAGPIPIGFSFYFNGLRYDSFYVSTNGLIALSNRRYFYDASGNRLVPPGANDCYDPMSMDWFARPTHTGDGTETYDNTPDNYGYQFGVLGNNPTNATAGIRARGGALGGAYSPWGTGNKIAVIAPFFGDLNLSQYWADKNMPDDFGKVYFKRTLTADRLYIYFVNVEPVRTLSTPYGSYTGPMDLRQGDNNFIAASAQVELDSRDSSVTIMYERFDGVAFVGGRGVPAATVFRYNTTVGVRGFARYTNYGQPGGAQSPWAGEYEQYTHYFSKYQQYNADIPHNSLAVKFKQWQNTIRVVDIQYRVRKTNPNADLDFTETVPSSKVDNYELLAGEERIGAIQPVAIIQNLTNNIQGPQGVNFQPQQLNFRARFRIVNEASGKVVYNRLVPIDSTCLALADTASYQCTGDPYVRVRWSNVTKSGSDYSATPNAFPGTNKYNGVPPYGFVQIYFPPFEPNEFVNNQIGRLRCFIVADPTNPTTQESLGDAWPFDDTTSVRIFVMKRLDNFNDDVTEYHIVNRIPMPSTLKWVNIDAEVASGDEVSVYPLPPRGAYPATNNPDFNLYDQNGNPSPDYTQTVYNSPVIRMDRLTLNRTEPATSPGGDVLRSFPIDLSGRYGAVLSLAIQRTVKQDDWPRGWCDQQLVGPEPRTVVNGDPFHVWTEAGGSASNPPDEIDIDYAEPSDDGITNICNIDNKRWLYHPRRGGSKPVTDMSAYALYGAGGAMRGYLESDKDSALSKPANGMMNGLRANIYDDGIDYEYNKIYIPIPDTIIKWQNEGAKNFRFRIAVMAKNNQKCTSCIPDDEDPFFVDNVRILFPSEITDIDVTVVKAQWPYTIAPASQAIKIPITVKVSNNTGLQAPAFLVRVRIFKQGDTRSVYCRTEEVPFMNGNTDKIVPMPNWDARSWGPGTYRLVASVNVPGGDLEPNNDTTYSDIKLNFGNVFAYDPATSPRNDVPDNNFTGTPGRGLNLYGFADGGYGYVYAATSGYDEDQSGAGYKGGSGSGQIAMKFTLYQTDTIYGYQAYFGQLNQALDDISLAIYTDQSQPGSIYPGTLLYGQRGLDAIRHDVFFGEYVTYLLPKPIVLPTGTYWMAISQMGETGLELGASKTRVGMRTTSIYIPPPITSSGPVGGSGISLVIDKTFRKINNTGNLINDNYFAFENTRGSGTWTQFMPTIGNPAYAHLHHFGTATDGTTYTLSRGTWIPMIRPYFGPRASGTNQVYEDCPDIPVELTYFDGQIRNSGVDLYWETASEQNNYGFYVERKAGRDVHSDYQTIGFIKGAGNSTTPNHYNFHDGNVVPNTMYSYRLRQVDRDGAGACSQYSKVLALNFDESGDITLDPNTPNPIANSTTISFYLPTEATTKLQVLDLFGNVVKTLKNETLPSSRYSVNWDGTNEQGNPVANGAYILKLTAGDQVKTEKMTVIR